MRRTWKALYNLGENQLASTAPGTKLPPTPAQKRSEGSDWGGKVDFSGSPAGGLRDGLQSEGVTLGTKAAAWLSKCSCEAAI